MGLFKFCPRCNSKIPYEKKYCDGCQEVVDKVNKERLKKLESNKEAKKNAQNNYKDKRWKDGQDFYNTDSWKRARDNCKIRFHGMCLLCYYMDNTICQSDVVHHIIEIRKDFSKRLDLSNLITLCSKHHSYVHYRYMQGNDSMTAMQDELRELIDKYDDEFKMV